MKRRLGADRDETITRVVSNQRAIQLAGAFGAIGVVLYLVPIALPRVNAPTASAIQSLAFGMVFTALFTAIWDVTMTPTFVDQVVAKVQLKHDVDDAQLEAIRVLSDEQWDKILGCATNVEVYFDVDGSWWAGRRVHLEQASHRGCKLKALVVDAADPQRRTVVESLCRFSTQLMQQYTSQIGFYKSINAQVKRSKVVPMATVIVVDNDIYIHTHRVSGYDSPFIGLHFKASSEVGREVRAELADLWQKGLVA